VSGLVLRDTTNGELREAPAEGLFVSLATSPTPISSATGFRPTPRATLPKDETRPKIEGVFIAGDVHDHRYRQADGAGDGCGRDRRPSAGSNPRARRDRYRHRL
jgi:thioredoxin reductase (NADPH)